MESIRIQRSYLEHLKSPNFNIITSIKSFNFSSLYTTILHKNSQVVSVLQIRIFGILKLYCGYKYTRHCMINGIWGDRLTFAYLRMSTLITKASTLKMTLLRCLSFWQATFLWFLQERCSSRQSTIQWPEVFKTNMTISISIFLNSDIPSSLAYGIFK